MNFYTNKDDIKKWLKKYNVENYIINNDLSVDVNGDVDLSNKDFTHFPVKFNRVSGDFDCYSCTQLTSLSGCPNEVGGSFYCFNCPNLTSLAGCPNEVSGDFDCHNCYNLTSLSGCPNAVGGSFYCGFCTKLTSLSGCPNEVGGNFDCSYCPQLSSLKGLPLNVAGKLYIDEKNKDDHHLQFCTHGEIR